MEDELIIRAELRDEVSAGARRVARSVDDVADAAERAERASDRASHSSLRLRSGLAGIVGAAGGAARGLTTLTRGLAGMVGAAGTAAAMVGGTMVAALGAGGIATVRLASNAAEVSSQIGVVFGSSSERIFAFTQDLHDRFGLATADLNQVASSFGVLGQAAGVPEGELAGFSEALTSATLDLGSFYNASPDEVGIAIRSGLVGETEPLRRFGIQINETVIKARAASMGYRGELTEQQKVLARNAEILDQFNRSAAAGDLPRTAEQAANMFRNVGGRIMEMGRRIGDALLLGIGVIGPTVIAMAKGAEDALGPFLDRLGARAEAAGNTFNKMPEWFAGLRDAINDAGVVSREAGEAMFALPFLDPEKADVLQRFYGRVVDLVGAVRETGPVSQEAGGALAAMFPEDLRGVVEEVVSVVRDLWTVFTDLLVPVLEDASRVFPAFLTPLGAARELLGFVADNAETLQPLVEGLVVGYLAWRAATVALNIVTAARNALMFITTARTLGLAAAQTAAATTSGGMIAGTAALNAVMAANPIVLVVAAVAALVAGLIWAYRNIEPFRLAVDRLWQGLKEGVAWVINQVVIPGIRGLLTVWTGVVEGLLTAGAKAARALGMEGLAEKLEGAAGEVRGFREAANRELDQVQDTIRVHLDHGEAMLKINEMRSALRDTGLAGASVNYDTQGGITVGAAPGGRVTERLLGGPVHAGSLYLVGEAGPELFLGGSGATLLGAHGPELFAPPEGGFIEPADRTAAMLAGAHASGPPDHATYHVNINGAQDPAAVWREFERHLDRRERDRAERRTRWQR